MIRLVRSTIIDAPTDEVWALLRDFNGHDQWHPAVGKSAIERGQSSDKVGCVRHFFLRNGAELREQLLTLSDLEQSFSYCWTRRFPYLTTSLTCGSPQSLTVIVRFGIGVVRFRPAKARKPKWPAWSARISTTPVSWRSVTVCQPRRD